MQYEKELGGTKIDESVSYMFESWLEKHITSVVDASAPHDLCLIIMFSTNAKRYAFFWRNQGVEVVVVDELI